MITAVIFDLTHYEMIHMWIKVLEQCNWKKIIITSSNIAEKLSNATDINYEYTHVVVTEPGKIATAFQKTSNVDLYIFNTIDGYYREISNCINHLPSKPKLVTLHNLRTWLNPTFTLNKRALSNYLYRYKILRKMTGIVVLDEDFIPYVKLKTKNKKLVFNAPYTIFENAFQYKQNNYLHIGIPGNIDGNHRRNYNTCIEIINILIQNEKRIKFIFGGEVMGEQGMAIKQKLDVLKQKGAELEFVFNPSTNKDFDNAMSSCDIILMPVNVNTRFEGIPEIYGKTKATGVIFDSIRFQKPILAPQEFNIPSYLKTCSVSYKNAADCARIITNLIANNEHLLTLQRNAAENAQNFNIENVGAQIIPHLRSVLSKTS